MLPKEMINEFIGKVCYVTAFNDGTTLCRLLKIEENWLKVKDESGDIHIFNGEMISSIQIAKEKYQTKCQ